MNENDLIEQLTRDLSPVARPRPLALVLGAWLLCSVVYVVTLMALLGPYRPGFADQLVTHPRFAFEMLLGIGALLCFAVAAFNAAVPGRGSKRILIAGWFMAAGWLSHFLAGDIYVVLEPSMAGKRELCALEAYLYSVPPLLAAIWLQHKRFTLDPVRAAVYAAVTAAMIPALVMQLACMYVPSHILEAHVLPVGILAGVTGIVTFVLAHLRERLRGRVRKTD